MRDEIGAGWNWPNGPKNLDVDALRVREDFQRVSAGVEAKAEKPRENK